jgi:hypothetical protein
MSGSYEFTALGRGIDAQGQRNSTEFAFTGVMSFMPDGTVTRLFSINSDGTIKVVNAADAGSSGKWTQNDSDCSGTISFPKTSIGIESYHMFFSQDGKKVCFINTATGVMLSGRMERARGARLERPHGVRVAQALSK